MFFTIGHSTRDLDEFIALLREAEVGLVIDVRRLPGSRRYPHFDQDPLRDSLYDSGVGYEHWQSLTGRRPVRADVPFEVNAWWRNRSFHNYADYALSDEFRAALEKLREAGRRQSVAIMCAEAVWWRCHRRIIADYLLAAGESVKHIMGTGEAPRAELSAGARRGPDGTVTYPAPK